MSTPQDSAAPPAPEPSTPSFVGTATTVVRFLKGFRDWILGLSPTGADRYDTGWVNLALINGWSVASGLTPQVRRVGRQVRIRGRVSGGSGAIATLDSQFRPDAQHQSAIRDGSANNVSIIIVSTAGAITVGTATQPNIDTGWFTA